LKDKLWITSAFTATAKSRRAWSWRYAWIWKEKNDASYHCKTISW